MRQYFQFLHGTLSRWARPELVRFFVVSFFRFFRMFFLGWFNFFTCNFVLLFYVRLAAEMYGASSFFRYGWPSFWVLSFVLLDYSIWIVLDIVHGRTEIIDAANLIRPKNGTYLRPFASIGTHKRTGRSCSKQTGNLALLRKFSYKLYVKMICYKTIYYFS